MKTILHSVFPAAILLAVVGCQSPLFMNSFGSSIDNERGDTSKKTSSTGFNPFSRKDPRQELRDRQTVDDFVARGRLAVSQNKLDNARLDFESALRIDKNNATAHQLMGQVGDLTGNFKEAETHYQQALKQRPNDPDLLSDIGYSYMQQSRFAEAKEKLERALEAYPNHRMANINIAAVTAYEGDMQRSMAYLMRVGTEQEAQQIMDNLMRNAPQGRGSQTQLVNNTRQDDSTPAMSDLRTQMEAARREATELRRRESDREEMEMRQRMTRAFGPGGAIENDGRISDRNINKMMSDVDRKHHQDINQLGHDNQSPITRLDDQDRNLDQYRPMPEYPNGIRMPDGRPAFIDPATGVVTPRDFNPNSNSNPGPGPAPAPDGNWNQNQNPWNQNQNPADWSYRGQQENQRQFPNSNGQVVPNQPLEIPGRMPPEDWNQRAPMGNGSNANQFNSNGQYVPNRGTTQNSAIQNWSQPSGVDPRTMSNSTGQSSGVWSAANNGNAGFGQSNMKSAPPEIGSEQMRAMQMGLAAGPGGLFPPDLLTPPSQQQQTVHRPETQGGQQPQSTYQPAMSGQQYWSGPQSFQQQPMQNQQSRQGMQNSPVVSQNPFAENGVAGQLSGPNSNNLWQPDNINSGASSGAGNNQVSPMEHSSSQGKMATSNWNTMPTAQPAQVPSATWNHETQLPHQQAGLRTTPAPMSADWQTGALSSPTTNSGFSQPHMLSRNPAETSNGISGYDSTAGNNTTSQFDMTQQRPMPNSNQPTAPSNPMYGPRY